MKRIALTLLVVAIGQVLCEEPPIVQTKSGKVRGYYRTIDNGDRLMVYEGIRFAKPPVGLLRFQPPQPVEPWSEVYNATGYRYACLQPEKIEPDNNIPETTHFSEDCLFLTVYKPKNESIKKRPVMMWIHGGGYETGSIFSIAYDARYIVTLGDVIVVATNYRLGAFGFMYAGTDDARGNNGLKDQVAALKWIQDNIEAFGGDPNQVTVFGESAGGMSIGNLVLSPFTKGLLHRAIMQSGAPNAYLGSEAPDKALVKTQSLAEKLNCTNSDMEKVVKCLRSVKAEDIKEATLNSRLNGETFLPVYKTDMLPSPPVQALKEGKFNTGLDFMFGVVSEEGSLFVEALFPSDLSPDIKNPTISVLRASKLIQLLFFAFRENYGIEVGDFYTKGLQESDKDGIRQAIGYAFGDYQLTCPTVFFGQYYGMNTKDNNVYCYRLMHSPSIPAFPDCHGWMGVCHGDDVMILFGFPIRLRGIVFTEEEYTLSIQMINAWTTFAKTGKVPKMGEAVWEPALDRTKQNPSVSYLALDTGKSMKMVYDYYTTNCDALWKNKIFA